MVIEKDTPIYSGVTFQSTFIWKDQKVKYDQCRSVRIGTELKKKDTRES